MKKIFFILILFLIIAGLVLPLGEVQAISLMDGVAPKCTGSGDCSVCDILMVVYNVGRFVFMSMAGIAMIMMVWAGIGLIFNFGNAEMVARNKKLLLHTFLGVIIILAAWFLVNALITVLSGTELGSEFIWKLQGENRHWYEGPTCS